MEGFVGRGGGGGFEAEVFEVTEEVLALRVSELEEERGLVRE